MIKEYNSFSVENFLNDNEILSLEYNFKNIFKSKTGDLVLYYQKNLSNSILNKVKLYIGDFKIKNSHIYELKQPYRLHCDAGKDNDSYYTIIIPLDKNPQGGLYIMNQYADYAYSLDDYYEQNYQPILSFEEQKHKIKNFDENKSLPDTIDFFHIKNKKGFTIKEFIKYEYNKAIIFPSKYIHCSQNIENFSSKKSLAIFTAVKDNFKLDPLCFKNETIDLNGVKTEYGMQVAMTNKGELIPCCYLDTPANQLDVDYQKLLKVSKISDYDNIEEIYLTKEWTEFVENLKKHKGFFACKITCPKREN